MHFIWPCSRLVRLLMPPIEAICWEFPHTETQLLFYHSIRATEARHKSTLSIQSSLTMDELGILLCTSSILCITATLQISVISPLTWETICKPRNVITVSGKMSLNPIFRQENLICAKSYNEIPQPIWASCICWAEYFPTQILATINCHILTRWSVGVWWIQLAMTLSQEITGS